MSSVDSVDLPGGQLALVFTLDGQKGNYGIKDSADARCPSCRVGVRQRLRAWAARTVRARR